jgi:transcriptional regulator CtsR
MYSEMFFATYRYFSPAMDILQSLIGWFNCVPSEEKYPGSTAFLKKNKKMIQSRSVRMLICWIRNHSYDFYEDPTLMRLLNQFVDYVSTVSFGAHQKILQALREQVLLNKIDILAT